MFPAQSHGDLYKMYCMDASILGLSACCCIMPFASLYHLEDNLPIFSVRHFIAAACGWQKMQSVCSCWRCHPPDLEMTLLEGKCSTVQDW